MADETGTERFEARERELLAEIARLRAQVEHQDRPDLRGTRTTSVGRDELFSAVEKTRMPMILTDPGQPDDPIIFANRAFQELSGYTSDELVGRNCRFLQGERTDEAQVQRIREALATNSDIAIEILNYRRDGSAFLNELYISPVFDRDGTLLYHFGSQLDVTGYKKARNELEASERRQRAIFDSSVDFAIVVTDRDGRVTDWNAGAERTLGWSADAMRGHTIERIFTPEDRAGGRAEVEMRQARDEGRASDERWHLKADGSRFFASGEMMPLREQDGTHSGYIKILRDRTKEHEAGQALRRTEDSLRRAQEVGGVGLFTLALPDGDLRPTPEFCRLYGLPVRDSYPPSVFDDVILPEDAGLISTAEARRRGEIVRKVEYRIRRADTGEVRWIARTGDIERDVDGRPVSFFGVVRDVTEQRAAQLALQTSEAYWRSLFEKLDEGFLLGEVIRGSDGRVVDWRYLAVNPAWGRMVGIDSSTVIGQSVRTLIPGIEDAWIDEMATVVETGTPSAFLRQVGVLGQWYEGHVYRTEGDRFAVTFSNVTVRRQEERRRNALIELGDRLRDEADPRAMTIIGAEVLGRTLDADRVGYGTVASDDETFIVEEDWTSPGFPSLAGRYRLDDYGLYAEDLRRGRAVAIADVRDDPRSAGTAANLEAVRARSLINLPVTERGRTVAILYVNCGEPRDWSDGDVSFARDVAERLREAVERRNAERALLASEAEVRLVADALPALVAFVDRDLTYRFANAAYREWFGLAPEDVVGRRIPDLVSSAGLAARKPFIDQALTGTPARVELEWPRLDGQRRIADIRYTPRLSARGDVDGFYIFVQDVTLQKDAEALLAARNASLAEEVQTRTAERNRTWALSPVLKVVTDASGGILAVNPAWTATLGWSEADTLGRNMTEFVAAEDHAAVTLGGARAAGGLHAGEFENVLATKDDGRRTVVWTSVPEEGRFYGFGRDVTEQRAVEDALRQSQKMEAVGQLTGGIAHDFNNLLTGITGSLELLNTRIAQGRLADIERYTTAAQSAAKRAAALTHRLLAFSRRQTLDPKPTDVNRLVAGLQDLVQRTVGPAVHVETVAAVNLWPTLVDPGQLENALLNLCINARDAMPDGGRITVETANRWMDRTAAETHGVPAGQYISLCVSDTGTGMPPEVVARAFEPFFTTKPLGTGTGLGLSMIYGFARQSGGHVRIYSELGDGTNVCLYLPRHVGEAEDDAAVPKPGEAPRALAGETVLVVDDEPSVRMLVTDILEDLGYAAVEAADGPSGLRVLLSDARVDLLVTDVGLPNGMNGRQLADAARQHRPDLKVLFITGYAENAVVGNGHLAAGMHVLTKPFAMDALAMKIRELITD